MPTMNLTEKRNKKKQFINKQELQNAVEGRTAHTQIAQPGSSRFEPLAQISSPAACPGSHAPCSRRARAGHATAARGCSRPHEPAALGAPASAARRRCHSGRLRELHSWAALGAVRLRRRRHQAGFLRWGKRSSQSGLGWVVVGHVGVNGCLGLGGVRVSRSGARG